MDVDKIRVFERNMNLVDVTGLFATVSTIGMMLAGLPLCTQMMREGTHNVQLFPFIAFFTNCLLWSEYGLLKHDNAIIIVNVTGCTLEGLYIFVYLTYTKDKLVVLQQAFGAFCVALPFLVYAKFVAVTVGKALSLLGKVCIVAGIVNFGSPLSSIKRVLQTKSSESMSFLWSFIATITAFQWTLYGYLRQDRYLIIPNGVGFILGAIQILLIFRYKPKAFKKSSQHPSSLI